MALDRSLLFRLATSSDFERAARSVPFGERLAWQAASRYVAGTTADPAFRVARELHGRGVGSSVDHFGEQVTDAGVAEQVAGDYLGLDIDPAGCAERVGGDKLGATIQANLHRAPDDLDRLVAAGVHVRLVKGAFVEPAPTSRSPRTTACCAKHC